MAQIEVEIRVGAEVLESCIKSDENPVKLRRLILDYVYNLPVEKTGLDKATRKNDDSIWMRLTQVINGEWVESAVFLTDGADIIFRRIRGESNE